MIQRYPIGIMVKPFRGTTTKRLVAGALAPEPPSLPPFALPETEYDFRFPAGSYSIFVVIFSVGGEVAGPRAEEDSTNRPNASYVYVTVSCATTGPEASRSTDATIIFRITYPRSTAFECGNVTAACDAPRVGATTKRADGSTHLQSSLFICR